MAAKLPSDRKRAVWKRDNYRCRYCNTSVCAPSEDMPRERWATVDHVVAKSRGGTNDKSNLVTACSACNAAKASKTVEKFKARGGRFAQRPVSAGAALKPGYRPAQAMSAGTAETQSGSGRQPASAVADGHAPHPNQDTPHE